MSAPAALAMAKLNYPEIEQSHTKTEDDVHMENLWAPNILHLEVIFLKLISVKFICVFIHTNFLKILTFSFFNTLENNEID